MTATTKRRPLRAGAFAIVALASIALPGPVRAKKARDSFAPATAPISAPKRNGPAGIGDRAGPGSGKKNDKKACTDAYTQAQEKAQTAHLREAKELLAKCAKVVCGSFLQKECGTLYTQLEADIPSIVPLVTDDAGQPMVLVEVKMDGELLTSRLDGHALPVDPGSHEFSFGTDAGVFATRKVNIMQGQRNRTISVKLKRGTNPSHAPLPAPRPKIQSTE